MAAGTQSMKNSMAPYPRLVGDVGGTHARFAWLQDAASGLADTAKYAAAESSGLEAAIERYLNDHHRRAPPSCAIGIATPVTGDAVHMTNSDWAFSIGEVKSRFGFERFVVVNDFAALALALPVLQPDELHKVGGGVAAADAALAVLGAGTGLGMSGLLPSGAGFVPAVGEGGHATLAAASEREAEVVGWLRERFGHASAERALSGDGLVNLYGASCALAGTRAETIDAPEVSQRALAGSDAPCVDAVELFFAFLGGMAGNLALTLGARGGVYIGGGIVPQLGDRIDRSAFRARFEAKGRFEDYLSQVPTWVITASESPALRGADRALDGA